MKKQIIIIASVFLCANSVFTACVKSNGIVEDYVTPNHSYKVYMEQPNDSDTKVYTDESYRVKWTKGDLICICNKESGANLYSFAGETGACSGDVTYVGPAKNIYFNGTIAFSCKSNINDNPDNPGSGGGGASSGGDGGDLPSLNAKYYYCFEELPEKQIFCPGTFGPNANPMACYSVNNSSSLYFKNLCGYLILKLYGTASVSAITLRGNNYEQLSGSFVVCWGYNHDAFTEPDEPDELEPRLEPQKNANHFTSLVCHEPITLSSSPEGYKEFWIALPPMEFTNGITITVANEDGYTYTKSTNKSISITRNKVSRMSPVEVVINDSYASSYQVPDAVDLNLPSGVKWASFDLGAAKAGEYGALFAWGETKPKQFYTKENYYSWFNHSKYEESKEIMLDVKDDAARVNLGGEWRIPNCFDIQELFETRNDPDHYKWEETTIKVNDDTIGGYVITCLSNGKSIFLNKSTYLSSYRGFGYNPQYSQMRAINLYEGHYIRPVMGASRSVEAIEITPSISKMTIGRQIILKVSTQPRSDILGDSSFRIYLDKGNGSVHLIKKAPEHGDGILLPISSGESVLTIRAFDGFEIKKDIIINDASYPVPQMIDLGLPSGIKWASWNLGADSSDDFGCYYSWGETQPKDSYDWSTYKWCNGSKTTLTKYCTYSSYWDSTEPMDNKNTLDLEDDAAHVNWGGSWRMPTDAEWKELKDNCTWTSTSDFNGTGVAGRIVTGQNGNSIFLPAAGDMEGSFCYAVNSFGIYWASSLDDSDSAQDFAFTSDYFHSSQRSRAHGFSVRPVTE